MNKVMYRLLSAVIAVALTMGGYFNVSAQSISASSALLSKTALVVLTSKIIYVNTNGSDSNSGVATSPFKTLAKGVSVLAAGDTLIVAGTYNESLIVSKSGTVSAPINIIGSAAVINVNNEKTTGITISGSYINVTGFEVMGATSHGVFISGKHIKFENSSVHNNVTENGVGTCNGTVQWGSAVKTYVGADDVIVRGNAVYANCGEGIGITRGVNVLVENNTVYDNFSVNIYIDNSHNVQVLNNYSYCTNPNYYRGGLPGSGVLLGNEYYDGWGSQLGTVLIDHNIIQKCKGIRLYNPISGVISNLTITNNTFNGVASPFVNVSGAVVSNNVDGAAIFPTPTITRTPSSTAVNPIASLTPVLSTQIPPSSTVAPLMTASPTQTKVSIATATSTKLSIATATSLPIQLTVTVQPTIPVASSTYYVSVMGNDVNDCSFVAPCKTFAKAITLAQPDDIVHVSPGVYSEQLVISKSSIIVEGDGAVINTSAQNGIRVTSAAQNVRVSGFTVTGTTSNAIFVEGKFVTIENNIVHDAITENGLYPGCGSAQWGSSIKAGKGSSDVIIRGNQIFHNCGVGIAATMSQNVSISGNTVYDNYSVNVYIDNSHNVSIASNIVYCTKTANNPIGIALGEESYSGWGAQLRDVAISGNTVTNCSRGIMAFASNAGGTLTNVTIASNLIPSGQSKGLSLDNAKNINVSVIKNVYYNEPWIRSTAGVTLTQNVVGTQTQATVFVTSTASPLPSATTVLPVTAISTSTIFPTMTVVSSGTPTSTAVLASPMPSFTVVPPSSTASFTPIPATSTPTVTFSASPTPIKATNTAVVVQPTQIQQTATLTSSEILFDDVNGGFIYSSGWQDAPDQQAYGGSYKVTSDKGATASFVFTGQSFSILFRTGPNYRNVDIYVDGVLVGTINQRGGIKYQQRWDYFGQLTSGSHTLELVTRNKANTYISFDALIVR